MLARVSFSGTTGGMCNWPRARKVPLKCCFVGVVAGKIQIVLFLLFCCFFRFVAYPVSVFILCGSPFECFCSLIDISRCWFHSGVHVDLWPRTRTVPLNCLWILSFAGESFLLLFLPCFTFFCCFSHNTLAVYFSSSFRFILSLSFGWASPDSGWRLVGRILRMRMLFLPWVCFGSFCPC